MNRDTTLTPIVSIENLHVAYDAKPVLQGLTWQPPRGEVVGLLGRNGSGKTTLLEAMLGLRDPDAGRTLLFGQSVDDLDDLTRARIGYVPQQSNLFEWMTAGELLAYFKSFYPRWNDNKVAGLLTRWGIDREARIAGLSGGQQQRLSIIRALAHEPDLLVLDEPVASLDPLGRRDFLQELVSEVVDRGTTVVFSTHILSDLERVAFQVAFLGAGRIVLQAPLDELIEGVRTFVGPCNEVRTQVHAQGWEVLSETPLQGGLTRLVARCPTPPPEPRWHGVEVGSVTLDDLYSALTK